MPRRSTDGLTVESVCSMMTELQSRYPEMPGVAFYGCGAGNETDTQALIKGVNDCALKLYPDGALKTHSS